MNDDASKSDKKHRVGPLVETRRRCDGCYYHATKDYCVEDGNSVDSGTYHYCHHPENQANRTQPRWDSMTPDWCPALLVAPSAVLPGMPSVAELNAEDHEQTVTRVLNLRAKADRLSDHLDEIYDALGYTKARCEQTGESPMDLINDLKAARDNAEREANALRSPVAPVVAHLTDDDVAALMESRPGEIKVVSNVALVSAVEQAAANFERYAESAQKGAVGDDPKWAEGRAAAYRRCAKELRELLASAPRSSEPLGTGETPRTVQRFNGIEADPNGAYVYYDDYRQLERELAEARTRAETLEQLAVSARETEKALYADRERLSSALQSATASRAIADVSAERRRQVEGEGWTAAHDDQHTHGDLAQAAACYAIYASGRSVPPDLWPWAMEWWKPKDRRRDLVRAAALVIAEIDRLDRAMDSTGGQDGITR